MLFNVFMPLVILFLVVFYVLFINLLDRVHESCDCIHLHADSY